MPAASRTEQTEVPREPHRPMTGHTLTRGFLFADLRGYAEFTDRHGDAAARELIGRYRTIVRGAIARHEGAEIRTEGDSFYVIFDSVAEAVLAGLDILAECAAGSTPDRPIRVGIGVHAGETVDTEEGIVSAAVNLAARLSSAAGPGELLVSDTVRVLTKSSFDVAFTSRGRRRLKGIAEPMAVYRVTREAPEPSSRVSRTMMLTAAAGTLVVLALLIAVGVGLRAGQVDNTAATSPKGSVVPSGQSPSAGPSEAFPNPVEAALLERLPERMTTTCDRADPELVPDRNYATHDGPLTVVAGVTCITGVTRVYFWEGRRADDIDSAFTREVGILRLAHGDCGEQSRAWQEWEFGAYSGKLLCYSASETLLEWTYGDEPILATATRRGGDFDDFMAWWRQMGVLLSR